MTRTRDGSHRLERKLGGSARPGVAELDSAHLELLFHAHGHPLGRLAASKLLPVGLIALLAKRALGPVLAARIAGMLEPSRAIDVAAKLPTMFLADVATHIDPRRASAVIVGIPPARIAEVAYELARDGRCHAREQPARRRPGALTEQGRFALRGATSPRDRSRATSTARPAAGFA